MTPPACLNKKWIRWSPSQDSIIVSFCHETSIHGFKFFARPNRQIAERIFWFVAFVLSLLAATYLIYQVWVMSRDSPVIVSFQSDKLDIDAIPFPAVILCNMNKFPRSKVMELERIASLPTHERYVEAIHQLNYVRSACSVQDSFATWFNFANNRGPRDPEADNNTLITEDDNEYMTEFLLNNTEPCDEFVRLCALGEELIKCSDLFKPIMTNYGKCCTFNMLPLPLLLRNPRAETEANGSLYGNPLLGGHGEKVWPPELLDHWKTWKYNDGLVLEKSSMRPWKQKTVGLLHGLSILVDPNIDEYYCPASDSTGIRYLLHSPLELPRVAKFGAVADINKEIHVKVHPDVTVADRGIRDIDKEKRWCYFGDEMMLTYFRPYTGRNCLEECKATDLHGVCGCTLYYMPRIGNGIVCDMSPKSSDFRCITSYNVNWQWSLKDVCGHCFALCEDIAYSHETTWAELQDVKKLWLDHDPEYHENGPPTWAGHKMLVMHIYFGSESIVPKIRKRLHGPIDLIASTGGILGLCLGFSILSGVEIIYFLCIWPLFKHCGSGWILRGFRKTLVKMFKRRNTSVTRVIHVNQNKVHIFPRDKRWSQIMGRHPVTHAPL